MSSQRSSSRSRCNEIEIGHSRTGELQFICHRLSSHSDRPARDDDHQGSRSRSRAPPGSDDTYGMENLNVGGSNATRRSSGTHLYDGYGSQDRRSRGGPPPSMYNNAMNRFLYAPEPSSYGNPFEGEPPPPYRSRDQDTIVPPPAPGSHGWTPQVSIPSSRCSRDERGGSGQSSRRPSHASRHSQDDVYSIHTVSTPRSSHHSSHRDEDHHSSRSSHRPSHSYHSEPHRSSHRDEGHHSSRSSHLPSYSSRSESYYDDY